MAFGLHNLTNQTAANATQGSGVALNQTSQRIWEVTGTQIAGGESILGLMVAGLAAYILYSADVSADVMAAVLIPGTAFLAYYDYLPYSTAVLYLVIVIVGLLFAWGVYRAVAR